MTRQDALAESVLQSRGLFMRYLTGFDDSNHTRTAPHLPNHVAWSLGHCAMTMLRASERVSGRFAGEGRFIEDQRSGDSETFGAESVSFGSNPTSEQVVFPRYARCIEIFAESAEHLAETIAGSSDATLDEHAVFFGGMSLPRWNVGPRIVFHNGHHCGQIADLRRALGMPSVF